MLLFDPLIIGTGLLILILCTLILKKYKKKSNSYLVCFVLFGIYLLYVFKYTLFPIPISSEVIQMYKQSYAEEGFIDVNMVPLHFKFDDYLGKANFLNILLSIPFGMGISYIMRTNKKMMLMLAIAFGTFIEGGQAIISLIWAIPIEV